MASRQREWQKKQQSLGNCMICGKPRDGDSVVFCDTCRKKVCAMRRKRYEMKVLEGGGR